MPPEHFRTISHINLTKRQHEVLVCMAKGCTHQQIADHLFISLRTVEREAARAAKALGVKGQTAAGARAYAEGLITDDHLAENVRSWW